MEIFERVEKATKLTCDVDGQVALALVNVH
jgi:hypothetical protein